MLPILLLLLVINLNVFIADSFDSYKKLTPIQKYPNVCDKYDNEHCAKKWMKKIMKVAEKNANRMSNVMFNYYVDINNNKLLNQLMDYQTKAIHYSQALEKKARKFKWKNFKNPTLKRIFKLMTPTIANSNINVTLKIAAISENISAIYNKANPSYKGKKLGAGESGIETLFKNERDYDILKNYWESWRNETGFKLKHLYYQRVQLENLGAKQHGYRDSKQFELEQDFEQKDYDKVILRLFNDIFPLYQQLHAYVRHCLWKYYPNKFDKDGVIPAHILGNVWAQSWSNIFPILLKCKGGKKRQDLTSEVDKNLAKLSVKQIFQMAERFFKSIGLSKMTHEFWTRSVLTKPTGKLVDCHGSASDFSNGHDFRIKMCTKKNFEDFNVVHHEMGHVQYFMSYRKLPIFFRNGANSGFHEAVGDTIALATVTPEYLKQMKLIDKVPNYSDYDIDFLMETALAKLAFLPYALTVESFSWAVYNGSVKESDLNKKWWELRNRFQGIGHPKGNDYQKNGFDAGGKYHVAVGVSYLRYFVSHILQYQFYEKLCQPILKKSPKQQLHRCNYYGNATGPSKRFAAMLANGKSKPWPETLKLFTGDTDKLSSKPLLNYFEPLYKWLVKTNKERGIKVGW